MSTKVALIFPGQGAQSVGMGKELYGSSPEAKAVFDKADTVIAGLSDVVFNGPEDKLMTTAYSQPGIFTVSMAALAAIKASSAFKNIIPVSSCGLSLGEYGALAACGALSFEETLKLIERRSTFMEEACQQTKGAMAAIIGMDKDQLIAICQDQGAEVANFNSPEQIVITGHADKVQAASEKIEAAGAKRVIPLSVGGAFHSSLMQSAADKFTEELAQPEFKKPEFPFISNVDATPTQDPETIRANLAKQITSSVRWVDCIEACVAAGVSNFIEIGPGTVLKGLMRKINREYKVYNIQGPGDIGAMEL